MRVLFKPPVDNETQRVLSEKAKGQSITELGLVVDDLKIPIRLFQMQSFSLGDQQCNPSTYLVYACLGDTGGRIGIGKHHIDIANRGVENIS
jgi:hypothetical protein